MFKIFFRTLIWFVCLTVIVPVAIGAALGFNKGWPENWRKADWGSSGLLPQASDHEKAQVMLLATRTGQWKSIFAEHLSIVLKPAGTAHYTRYDVVGWGTPVRRDAYAADAYWYGNTPRVIYKLDGDEAAALIPRIETAIAQYPWQQRGSYVVWPGPNSNTFVSWVVRHTKGFATELPPVAVGKDWLGPGIATGPAPSKTGYSFSIAGFLGGTLAVEEGLEIHLLGSTIGIDPNDLAIKLPALGKLSLPGVQ